jgi:hypothetical protein
VAFSSFSGHLLRVHHVVLLYIMFLWRRGEGIHRKMTHGESNIKRKQMFWSFRLGKPVAGPMIKKNSSQKCHVYRPGLNRALFEHKRQKSTRHVQNTRRQPTVSSSGLSVQHKHTYRRLLLLSPFAKRLE